MFFGSFGVFMHVFKECFYKNVKKTCFFYIFFICKLMFLTSISYINTPFTVYGNRCHFIFDYNSK